VDYAPNVMPRGQPQYNFGRPSDSVDTSDWHWRARINDVARTRGGAMKRFVHRRESTSGARAGALFCLWSLLLLVPTRDVAVDVPPPGDASATKLQTRGDAPGAAEAPARPVARTCNDDIPRETPAEALKYKVTVHPDTSWRPVGGEVRVDIEGQNITLDGLMVKACCRPRLWDPSRKYVPGDPVKVYSWVGNKIDLGIVVPPVDENGARAGWFDDYVSARFLTMQKYSSLVPIRDLRIIGTGGPAATTPLDVVVPIGITSVLASFVTTVVALACAMFILRRFVSSGNAQASNFLLAVIATKNGFASLSQFQVMLWTLVVGASSLYVILSSGNLVSISNDVLALLGISGVTLLGANLKTSQTGSTAKSGRTKSPAAGGSTPIPAPARAAAHAHAPAPAPVAVAQATPQTMTGGQAPGALAATGRAPRWSDLIANPDSSGEIDVTRVQMLFFTVISAIFVSLKVFQSYSIPDLPSGYLLLMGISNGVYLTNKFVPQR
jgi:hypothetical protein